MVFDTTKKVLFVIGMEPNLEPFIKTITKGHPENLLILQTFGPVISQPFGDLMRDILVAVYQEGVEEIFVAAATDHQKDSGDIFKIVYESQELLGKIQTIEYLFKNCTPEFPGSTLREWLAGSKTVMDGVQKSVSLIRNHPLLPSQVKVHGLMIDTENGELSETSIF